MPDWSGDVSARERPERLLLTAIDVPPRLTQDGGSPPQEPCRLSDHLVAHDALTEASVVGRDAQWLADVVNLSHG
jgi:hypothetical protein